MFLIMGVTLYTSRIVLNALGVEDYGIYNVVGGIVVMFSFLNGAMSQSTQRFLSYEIGRKNINKLQETFSASMTLHIIIVGILVLLAETLGLWFLNTQMIIPVDRIIPANIVYQCSILAFAFSISQVPYNASIVAHERMQAYAYISIIEVILKLGVAFILVLLDESKLIIYSVMILCIVIAINITYKIYCKRNFPECRYRWKYDKELIHSMSGYATWSTLGAFAWVGKSQGFNLILNVFLGPVVNAAYGITNQVNTALNSFVQNFTTAINPQIVKSYAMKDFNRCYSLVYYGCKMSFFLMLILSVPVLLTAGKLLELWLKTVPEYTIVFTRLIILNSLLESITFCMSMAIQASGKIKVYQIVVGLSTLLNLPVAWILLYNGFKPEFIFIASIIITVITLFERLIIMRYVLVNFSTRTFFKTVLSQCFIISTLISLIFIMARSFIDINNCDFILVILVSMITTGMIIFFVGLSNIERKAILNIVMAKLRQ